MVDHVVGINNSVGGQMMIRDTGANIEFWIKSGNSSSWDGELGWSGTVNGVGVGGTFYYGLPGGVWRQIGVWATGYSQTITFNKTTNSGSQGLGHSSWTSMSIYSDRGSVPPPPTNVSFTYITHDSVRTTFSGFAAPGLTTTEYQISFGTNGGAITGSGNTIYSTSGTKDFPNLLPGQYYAAWARGKNAKGWSDWGPGNSFYTLAGCLVRVDDIWKRAIPYVKVDGVWKPAVPHIKKDGVWQPTTP